jgi:hypothetical protein
MGRQRAGRKRKPGKREPNGKLSRRVDDKQARRTIDEQAAMQVGKEARQRVFKVSAEDSATELAGTVCGRLRLIRSITVAQHEAAKAFAATYQAYQRALNSPRSPKAVEIGAATGRGEGIDLTPEQHARALYEWDKVTRLLSLANGIHRHTTLYAACDYLILRDELHEHLVPDLHIALDYLVSHYGLRALAA